MAECFEVEIESLNLGKGVSHREGKTVFIDGALPSERVHYELVKSKPHYEVGRIAAVLRPSVDRAWGYRHRARLSVRYVQGKGVMLVGFMNAPGVLWPTCHPTLCCLRESLIC